MSELDATGRLFTHFFHTKKLPNKLNKQYWLTWKTDRVGQNKLFGEETVSFLVLHTFSKKDSLTIDVGVKDANHFYFHNEGHIMHNTNEKGIDNFVFFNPIIPGAQKSIFREQNSIGLEHDLIPQYVFDSSNVITKNLKFILRRKEGVWYLLYNFLHTPQFKKFYNLRMKNTSDSVWGADVKMIGQSGSIRGMLDKYAASLQVETKRHDRSGNVRKAYLDPTSNMFIDQDQSKESALFGANYVEQDPTQVHNNAHTLNQLGATGKNGVQRSLCFGGPFEYVMSLQESDTFMMDFPSHGEGNVDCLCCVVYSANIHLHLQIAICQSNISFSVRREVHHERVAFL